MSDTESELGSEEGNLNEGTASGSGVRNEGWLDVDSSAPAASTRL